MRQGAAALSWCSVTFRCTASHACREIGRGKERLHYPGSALHFVARRHMPAVKSDAARSGCNYPWTAPFFETILDATPALPSDFLGHLYLSTVRQTKSRVVRSAVFVFRYMQ